MASSSSFCRFVAGVYPSESVSQILVVESDRVY